MAVLKENRELKNDGLTREGHGGIINDINKEKTEFLDCISVILLGYAKHLREKGELK